MTTSTNVSEGQPRGTKQATGALAGKGLLQSEAEWNARNRELAHTLAELMARYVQPVTGRALDVGCMSGDLTDRFSHELNDRLETTKLAWWGVDPDIPENVVSPSGAILSRAFGHDLPYQSDAFDCITFANVYEHVPPTLRQPTLQEFHRVLAPGGILVGQLPNPYFPIESHSRLPFLGCLPRPLQRVYWRLTPTGWDFDKAHFFSVTIDNLKQTAKTVGLEATEIRNFNYSLDAIPQTVRWAARLHANVGFMPWSWQFVFRKPA